ncbi:MAG: T9SS type A sorting domain-containing protein [Bacteroidota bacterium]
MKNLNFTSVLQCAFIALLFCAPFTSNAQTVTHTDAANAFIVENPNPTVTTIAIQNPNTTVQGLRVGIRQDNSAYLFNSENTHLDIMTAGQKIMRFSTAGNVGIGLVNTDADAKLEIFNGNPGVMESGLMLSSFAYPASPQTGNGKVLSVDDRGNVILVKACCNPVTSSRMSNADAQIQALEARIAKLEALISKNGLGAMDAETQDRPYLESNFPNPFNATSTLPYYLPQSTQKASILVHDVNGKQVKAIQLTQLGQGQVEIAANALNAGVYLYTLVVDGQKVSTKEMILTK